MNKRNRILLSTLFMTISSVFAQTKAIYAGGSLYNDSTNIAEIKRSGFNTIIIWTLHLKENGDINFNFDFDLIEDGTYVGAKKHPNFVQDVARLKHGSSSVDRIEFGIGSWEGQQFEVIKQYYEKDGGFPETSPIYKNFKKLKETFPMVDAINNDDEFTYDLPSTAAFMKMLAELGFKNTVVPYKNSGYWKELVQEVNEVYPNNIDRNYLQCYAGGSGNSPCDERWDLGIPLVVGLWGGTGQMSSIEINNTMVDWNQKCNVGGGFIWLYDNVVGEAKRYAQALESHN